MMPDSFVNNYFIKYLNKQITRQTRQPASFRYKPTPQLARFFCKIKVLVSGKISLKNEIIFLENLSLAFFIISFSYKCTSSLTSSLLGGSRQNVSTRLAEFRCLVFANEISEKEAATGGALHKTYSFWPAQYYFDVGKTSPKNHSNLSRIKNFLNKQ